VENVQPGWLCREHTATEPRDLSVREGDRWHEAGRDEWNEQARSGTVVRSKDRGVFAGMMDRVQSSMKRLYLLYTQQRRRKSSCRMG
jgi:hypothetical protein